MMLLCLEAEWLDESCKVFSAFTTCMRELHQLKTHFGFAFKFMEILASIAEFNSQNAPRRLSSTSVLW
jgi:hypothetical protein